MFSSPEIYLVEIKEKQNGNLIPLNQQLNEISQWDTSVISCAAQIYEQQQKFIYKYRVLTSV